MEEELHEAKATHIRQLEYCDRLKRMGVTDPNACKCGGLKTPKIRMTTPPKPKQSR